MTEGAIMYVRPPENKKMKLPENYRGNAFGASGEYTDMPICRLPFVFRRQATTYRPRIPLQSRVPWKAPTCPRRFPRSSAARLLRYPNARLNKRCGEKTACRQPIKKLKKATQYSQCFCRPVAVLQDSPSATESALRSF